MHNKIFSITLGGAIALFLSQSALAHPGGKANAGDASGHLVRDSVGNCVHTSAWTKDLALAECESGMAPKKAEVVAEVKPAPVRLAPPVAVKPVAKPEAVFETVTLKAGALFDSGNAELKPMERGDLDELVAKLKTHQDIESIQVTG